MFIKTTFIILPSLSGQTNSSQSVGGATFSLNPKHNQVVVLSSFRNVSSLKMCNELNLFHEKFNITMRVAQVLSVTSFYFLSVRKILFRSTVILQEGRALVSSDHVLQAQELSVIHPDTDLL